MPPSHDQIWIEPTQTRSREKVDRMLNAAIELAVEQGSLDIKVTEVAKRAGVAIGTLYQFFPTRTALIAKLFASEMRSIDEALSAALTTSRTFQDLSARIEHVLQSTLALVRQRPGLSLIWSSASLDPVIEAADLANTRQNAKLLSERLMAVLPAQTPRSRVEATAMLICHLWSSVVRLCVNVDPAEEAVLVKEYARMLAAHGRELARAT